HLVAGPRLPRPDLPEADQELGLPRVVRLEPPPGLGRVLEEMGAHRRLPLNFPHLQGFSTMNRGDMTSTWGRAALAAVVLAAGCGKKTPELKFETAQVDRGRIVSRVTATGTLSALVTVQVGSQVSGRIAQLFVDYNSPVTKGDVIAKIDPQLFEAALEQAKANQAAAQGELTKSTVQAADAQRQ